MRCWNGPRAAWTVEQFGSHCGLVEATRSTHKRHSPETIALRTLLQIAIFSLRLIFDVTTTDLTWHRLNNGLLNSFSKLNYSRGAARDWGPAWCLWRRCHPPETGDRVVSCSLKFDLSAMSSTGGGGFSQLVRSTGLVSHAIVCGVSK